MDSLSENFDQLQGGKKTWTLFGNLLPWSAGYADMDICTPFLKILICKGIVGLCVINALFLNLSHGSRGFQALGSEGFLGEPFTFLKWIGDIFFSKIVFLLFLDLRKSLKICYRTGFENNITFFINNTKN